MLCAAVFCESMACVYFTTTQNTCQSMAGRLVKYVIPLNVALEENDLGLIMATLGDIARARKMAVVAQEAGLGREGLYKSLSAEGNPEFATVLKVVRALGLQLHATTSTERTSD